MSKSLLAEQHSFTQNALFQAKSLLLVAKRMAKNAFSHPLTFTDKQQLQHYPVIAVSESLLWNADDNPQNWILTAGKIENLRIATKMLNGIEVAANEVFSFWQHIGNPNIGKGFVVGREIREGCIVPTIAGGLCQISNALYDAALNAQFEIVERHRHSKVIKGSLAEKDRDATVKWNYVDLRFKSQHAFRIEVELTATKLIVKFRSVAPNSLADKPTSHIAPSKLNDCYSCGNFACFKHQDRTHIQQNNAITTFIVDEKWNEFDQYIHSIATDKDRFIVPIFNNRFFTSPRYQWRIPNHHPVITTTWAAIQRAMALRWLSSKQNNVFSLLMRKDQQIAQSAARHIPIESTHLVIAQNLLPFLWKEGVLGGRTFDVLMTRLPMEKLHERLDFAHQIHAQSPTLHDFRAPQHWIDWENCALTQARNIITPHQEIVDIFTHKSVKINWFAPYAAPQCTSMAKDKILFPASGLGRKGAYEVKQLALDLGLTVVITGKAIEDAHFWEGVKVEYATTSVWEQGLLVVYPTYVEHQPRGILKALSAGNTVITTPACGLSPQQNLILVPMGDVEALKEAVRKQLEH